MNRIWSKRVLVALMAIAFLFALLASGLADAGNFAGDSDWGGGGGWDSGGWDSGSDWSWSSDSDWGEGSIEDFPMTLVVVIIIVLFIFFNDKRKRSRPVQRPVSKEAPAPDFSALLRKDPLFSQEAFLEETANLFVRLNDAIEAGDLGPVRTRMSPELFARYESRLSTLSGQGQKEYFDRVAVLGTKSISYAPGSDFDRITVEIRARLNWYVRDSAGRIVQGSDSKELFKNYRWTMSRSAKAVTEGPGGELRQTCRNCGGPVSKNNSGLCPHCGVVLPVSQTDWVVTDITESAAAATGGTPGETKGMPVSIEDIKKTDPGFDGDEFLNRVRDIYLKMQSQWSKKEWEPMRRHMTDALFHQMGQQLREYIDGRMTSHLEELKVTGCNIVKTMRDDTNDIITVRIKASFVNHVTSDVDGKTLRGDRSLRRHMTYEWTMVRRTGVKTGDAAREISCEACGAELDISHSVKCDYCGSMFVSDHYDWVVSAIRGISQSSERR
ncbi:MAG: TIM44-like domain-containing protein [Christensenellales bacterium]